MSTSPALTFYKPKILFQPTQMAIAIVVASIASIFLGLIYGIVMHYAASFAHAITAFLQEGHVSRLVFILLAASYALWALLPLLAGFFIGMLVGQPVQQANRHPATPLFFLLSLALLALAFLLAWLSWLIIGSHGSLPDLQSLSNAWAHGTPDPEPDARNLGLVGKAGYFLEPLAFFICALPGFIPNKNKAGELCATCSQPLTCLATSDNTYYARFRLPADLPAFRQKITHGDLSALAKLAPAPSGTELVISVLLPHCPNCPNVRLLTVEETIDINADNPDGQYSSQTNTLLQRLVIPPSTFDKIAKFLTHSDKISNPSR